MLSVRLVPLVIVAFAAVCICTKGGGEETVTDKDEESKSLGLLSVQNKDETYAYAQKLAEKHSQPGSAFVLPQLE